MVKPLSILIEKSMSANFIALESLLLQLLVAQSREASIAKMGTPARLDTDDNAVDPALLVPLCFFLESKSVRKNVIERDHEICPFDHRENEAEIAYAYYLQYRTSGSGRCVLSHNHVRLMRHESGGLTGSAPDKPADLHVMAAYLSVIRQ